VAFSWLRQSGCGVGDAAAHIELLRSSLAHAGDHIDLIEALQQLGRAREALQAAEAARRRVIDVDDFAKEELMLESGKVR
jgi:hypothetical protein